jgi:hypothetical protein
MDIGKALARKMTPVAGLLVEFMVSVTPDQLYCGE